MICLEYRSRSLNEVGATFIAISTIVGKGQRPCRALRALATNARRRAAARCGGDCETVGGGLSVCAGLLPTPTRDTAPQASLNFDKSGLVQGYSSPSISHSLRLAMNENHDEAALRHWRDAELLYAKQRLDKADQLYGLAAECAVKVVLSRLPGCCATDGRLNKGYLIHIDALWEKLPLQNLSKFAPGLASTAQLANPFLGWTIEQRYAGDGSIPSATIEKHRATARRVLGACGLTGSRAS